eukprot:scaffold46374_cov66-Phaeocystis_antarctica.AAC.5
MSLWLLASAYRRAVWPFLDCSSGLAPARSRSFTHAPASRMRLEGKCPLPSCHSAHIRAVTPWVVCKSTLAPRISNILTIFGRVHQTSTDQPIDHRLHLALHGRLADRGGKRGGRVHRGLASVRWGRCCEGRLRRRFCPHFGPHFGELSVGRDLLLGGAPGGGGAGLAAFGLHVRGVGRALARVGPPFALVIRVLGRTRLPRCCGGAALFVDQLSAGPG